MFSKYILSLIIWLALLVAATLVQIVTAKHWKQGVPLSFTNLWQEMTE